MTCCCAWEYCCCGARSHHCQDPPVTVFFWFRFGPGTRDCHGWPLSPGPARPCHSLVLVEHDCAKPNNKNELTWNEMKWPTIDCEKLRVHPCKMRTHFNVGTVGDLNPAASVSHHVVLHDLPAATKTDAVAPIFVNSITAKLRSALLLHCNSTTAIVQNAVVCQSGQLTALQHGDTGATVTVYEVCKYVQGLAALHIKADRWTDEEGRPMRVLETRSKGLTGVLPPLKFKQLLSTRATLMERRAEWRSSSLSRSLSHANSSPSSFRFSCPSLPSPSTPLLSLLPSSPPMPSCPGQLPSLDSMFSGSFLQNTARPYMQLWVM